ncbi:hypothetical protein [Deinococcus cellulosilyticus]|uniref:Uncharacterized protein n=1 Tax=Deinococcus cellulosilyticus (strain DSM 18568 / NBRC 106333 / KACC 11606 / 5516J-15) TaxID=1223518 RepID=A0A511N6E1_DEIC1|nr:hypothetical protein [Deinococcus cellulosilyticus]GEM48415.1 hypothetical protein DC3_40500 [Deinococcus cellulosilyticus NBRC 106333 = KACC 11606]
MNFKQWLGLEPEHTFYESFTVHAAIAGIKPDGEIFANWCNDPGKTVFMIELRRLPAMPSRLIYLHHSGVELLDVVQAYEFKDGLLTLVYRETMTRLVRAKGCKVFIDNPHVDLQDIERVLRVMFAEVRPDFSGLPAFDPGGQP